jgi:hypothetical protein
MHEAAFHDLLDLDELDRVLVALRGRKGEPVVRDAIAMHLEGSAGTRSNLEDWHIEVVAGAGVVLPAANIVVSTPLGPVEADCVWASHGVVVEVDGPGHARPTVQRVDDSRQRGLELAGFVVRRVTRQTLRHERGEYTDWLRQRLPQT